MMIQNILQKTDARRVMAGRRALGFAAAGVGSLGFLSILAWSGVTAFQRDAEPVPLAVTERAQPVDIRSSLGDRPAPVYEIAPPAASYEEVGGEPAAVVVVSQPKTRPAEVFETSTLPNNVKLDRQGRPIYVDGEPWTGEVFDHRPIRPVRAITMKTTAYSPDERSCGKWADGITASGKSVWMNGGRLVAADRKIPYGTILTVPGYNNGKPVQVWDRGGKIKGNRLDLLYPTHEIARRWGVQDKRVVFWQFVETD